MARKNRYVIQQDEARTRRSLFNKPRIAIFIGVLFLIAFILLCLHFLILPGKSSSSQSKSNHICSGSFHETYNLTSSSLLGKYERFAIASDNAYCGTVANEILLKNGSAVDAAIATGLCNSLINSHSTGIGGGHFMVIYLKNEKKVYAIDAREQAPKSSHKSMYSDNNASSLKGGLSTAIPGEIYGYWEAHKIGGKLPWKTLFEPAIKMCREGFRVSKVLENALRKTEVSIRKNKDLSEIFINPETNKIYKENEIVTMPKLAETLRIISEENVKAFYDGQLTKLMVDEINENGGNVTVEDFQGYKALVKEPISIQLDDEFKIYTQPLPSSGVLVAFIIKLMRGFDLNDRILSNTKDSALYYHRLVEAFKHAFSHRSLLGDENYEQTTGIVKNLTDENYINHVRGIINDSTTHPSAFYGEPTFGNDNGTSHLSILADGDAVSLTGSVNTYFGAVYSGSKTGIIYNNQMDDFSSPNIINYFGLKPSEANYIKPGKRPMSSMSPIIVLDKNENVRLVLGAAGGSKIITSIAQVAIKNLWLGKNIKESIDDMRLHHQLYPEYLEIEQNFDAEVQKKLINLKHKIRCFEHGGSNIQGVSVDNFERIYANCDARKGGVPAGL